MKSEKEYKDWLNDYKSLKQVNTANPFIVPAGYFDDLADRIVALKNLNELTNNVKSAGFIVPQNYFEELPGNIEAGIAVAAVINNDDTGFTVPPGYFDTLGQQINSRLFIDEVLSANDNAFAVPEGYFDNLEQQIKSRLFVEEVLSTNEDAFAVPDGYFDGLTHTILNQTTNTKKVEQRGVIRKLFALTAVKYATAACLALVIGGGILLRQINNNPAAEHKNSFLHKELLSVPVDDIKSYLQLNNDAGDTQQTVVTQGAQVDDDKLNNGLQNYLDSVQ
jgi:hypothetical protein